MGGVAQTSQQELAAGIATVPLIVDPGAWINRRVETVELLSYEETRRRVSVDFTLSPGQIADLTTSHGVVVPLAPLTKAARRNFDLRDECGASVPVLGRADNGTLAHTALVAAAHDALPDDLGEKRSVELTARLREIVFGDPSEAYAVLADIVGRANSGDAVASAVWGDPVCRSLMSTLWSDYVLFAVLRTDTAPRRVLKYSYGDDFEFGTETWGTPRDRLARLIYRDVREFVIHCPAAWRSQSFHLEIIVPEELRIRSAVLLDSDRCELGASEEDVNRASLYADVDLEKHQDADAYATVCAERAGFNTRSVILGLAVSALLLAGVVSELRAENPGPSVSILLAGAALFSGLTAESGEHRLVRALFRAGRVWLAVIASAALVASITLAMEIPHERPVCVWKVAFVISAIASVRLAWSWVRAAG